MARRFFRRRRGAGAVEYGLLVGLIAVAVIAAVAGTGVELKDLLGRAAGAMRVAETPLQPEPPTEPTEGLYFWPARVRAVQGQGCVTAELVNRTGAAQQVALRGAFGSVDKLDFTCLDTASTCNVYGVTDLAPEGRCTVGFGSTSQEIDDRELSLEFGSNAHQAQVAAALGGNGSLPRLLAIVPGTLTLTDSGCVPVRIDNLSDTLLNQTVAFEGSGANAFNTCELDDNPMSCAAGVPANGSCRMGLRLLRQSIGTSEARFVVSAEGSTSATVRLRGTRSSNAPAALRIHEYYYDLALTGGPPSGAPCVEVNVLNYGGPASDVQFAVDGAIADRVERCQPATPTMPACGSALGEAAWCSLGFTVPPGRDLYGSATLTVTDGAAAPQAEGVRPMRALVEGYSRSCAELYEVGFRDARPYSIRPNGSNTAAQDVGCDMTDGGWTPLQSAYSNSPLIAWETIGGYAGTVTTDANGVRLQGGVACTPGAATGVRVQSWNGIPHARLRIGWLNVQNGLGTLRAGAAAVPTGSGMQSYAGTLDSLTFTATCSAGGTVPFQPDGQRGPEFGAAMWVQ